jgi:hypothetical protein
MIANQGGTILGIDQENGKVLFQGVDGKHQICDVKAWFTAHGTKTARWQLAQTFAFEVDGFDLAGEPVTVRYDGTLEGLGEPVPRAADGTFGTKASRRLNDDVQSNYGREGVIQ